MCPGTGPERVPIAPWARYFITVVFVGAALAARFAMLPVNGGLAFVTFYPVIISAAMLFGTGPALLAVLLSGACAGSSSTDHFDKIPVSPQHVIVRQQNHGFDPCLRDQHSIERILVNRRQL